MSGAIHDIFLTIRCRLCEWAISSDPRTRKDQAAESSRRIKPPNAQI
jgi:hypothetical protein